MSVSSCVAKCLSHRLENIDENAPPKWLPVSSALPETPTESMEFLARSWSLSAMELSKALTSTDIASNILEKTPLSSIRIEAHDATHASSMTSKESVRSLLKPFLSSEMVPSNMFKSTILFF